DRGGVDVTVPIIVDLIPDGRGNRPGIKMTPRYITIHNTGNPSANALDHAAYVKSDRAVQAMVSWHYTVDDHRIVQHLPLDEVGWHAGDGVGPGNRLSIGIEICEHAGIDQARAEANAAWLVADLLRRFNLGLEAVKQHHDWSGKNCPRILRGRPGGWGEFMAMV